MGAILSKKLSFKNGKVHSKFKKKKKNSGCGSLCCDNYMSGAKSTDNLLDSIKSLALQKNAQTMEIITQAHIHTPTLKRRKPMTDYPLKYCALSIDTSTKAAYLNVLCVQTDTKLISGPAETALRTE